MRDFHYLARLLFFIALLQFVFLTCLWLFPGLLGERWEWQAPREQQPACVPEPRTIRTSYYITEAQK